MTLTLFLADFTTSGAVLKHSDVIFMYQADAKIYAQYGATALCWGGKPTPDVLAAVKGLKFFGSVGMVTEFARYYERFPTNYEQGLCRDIDGKPVKVPWLTDHQHKGVPFWWCCTHQPLFRKYLSERVMETIKAGADGLHIDDHLGTSGGLWLGICFCDECNTGFGKFLQGLPEAEIARFGLKKGEAVNFRETVKAWLALDQNKKKKPTEHPLWNLFTIYQCRSAAEFMQELRDAAAKAAGHTVPVGANAGLLWPRHLADYKALDLFSAETDHHASARKFSDTPLFAYRLADAVARPYVATASGQDWAFIKEQNLPGLVRGWVAQSYAAGHFLMVPQRQWCYTPEKGTHWYAGPAEKFVPLYQFVRQHAELFDNYETYADVSIVLPHRSFINNPSRWFNLCNQLAASNICYRLLLASDEIVDCPLTRASLASAQNLLAPERNDLLPADRQTLDEILGLRGGLTNLQQTLAAVAPAVKVEAKGAVRAWPRVKTGSAVIHLVNYNYDTKLDDVRPLNNVTVKFDQNALGVKNAKTCRWVPLEGPAVQLALTQGKVEIPSLGLWGLLHISE